jgi:hypothetical protein
MRAPRSSVKKNLDVNLQKDWWIVSGSGPNKILPVKTTHKHREADKSARLIILARIIMCNIYIDKRYWLPPQQWHKKCLLMFLMQLRKRTKLSMYHFTRSILQVSYLYFPKGGSTSIMS